MGTAPNLSLCVFLATVILVFEAVATTTRPLVEDEPLPVLVSLVLREITDISDTSESFTADFYLALRYQDPNALAPFIAAAGTPQEDEEKIIIGSTTSTYNIQPLTLEFVNEVSGSYVYSDYEVRRSLSDTGYGEIPVNSSWGWVELHLRRRGTYKATFNLRSFPFDTQQLHIGFEDVDRNLSHIRYYDRVVEETDLNGLRGPSGFKLLNHIHEETSTFYSVFNEQYSLHTYTIELQRESGAAYGVRIIGPLLITTMMSFFLFCYKLTEDKRHPVSATLFLAVVTYMFIIRTSLPDLPYTTRIDNFILCCLMNNMLCFSWHALGRMVGAYENKKYEAEMLRMDKIVCCFYLLLIIVMGFSTILADMEFSAPVSVYFSVLGVQVFVCVSIVNGVDSAVLALVKGGNKGDENEKNGEQTVASEGNPLAAEPATARGGRKRGAGPGGSSSGGGDPDPSGEGQQAAGNDTVAIVTVDEDVSSSSHHHHNSNSNDKTTTEVSPFTNGSGDDAGGNNDAGGDGGD